MDYPLLLRTSASPTPTELITIRAQQRIDYKYPRALLYLPIHPVPLANSALCPYKGPLEPLPATLRSLALESVCDSYFRVITVIPCRMQRLHLFLLLGASIVVLASAGGTFYVFETAFLFAQRENSVPY